MCEGVVYINSSVQVKRSEPGQKDAPPAAMGECYAMTIIVLFPVDRGGRPTGSKRSPFLRDHRDIGGYSEVFTKKLIYGLIFGNGLWKPHL
jgi:hypothetical protein